MAERRPDKIQAEIQRQNMHGRSANELVFNAQMREFIERQPNKTVNPDVTIVTRIAIGGLVNFFRIFLLLQCFLTSTSINGQSQTTVLWNLSKYHGAEFIKKCGYFDQYDRGIPELAIRIKDHTVNNKSKKSRSNDRSETYAYYQVTFLYSDHYNKLLHENVDIDDAYQYSIFSPYAEYFASYLVECPLTYSDVSHRITIKDFENQSTTYASYDVFYEHDKVVIMEHLQNDFYNKFARRILLYSTDKSAISFHILKMFSTSMYWGDAVSASSSGSLNRESALLEIECLNKMNLADPNQKY